MTNYYRTKILASIKSLNEISLVLKKGVDIIDFKDPTHGALGEIPTKKIMPHQLDQIRNLGLNRRK